MKNPCSQYKEPVRFQDSLINSVRNNPNLRPDSKRRCSPLQLTGMADRGLEDIPREIFVFNNRVKFVFYILGVNCDFFAAHLGSVKRKIFKQSLHHSV